MPNSSNMPVLQENYVVTTTGTAALENEQREANSNALVVIAASVAAFAVLSIVLLELGLVQSFAKKYAANAPGVLGDLLEYLATRPSLFRKNKTFYIIKDDSRYDLTPLYNYLCLNDYLDMEGILVKVNSFSMREDSFVLDLVGFREGYVVDVEPSGGVIIDFGDCQYTIRMPNTTELIKNI